MSDHADPTNFACPDGPASECTGRGARDCPFFFGEPLHYHHDGRPAACYVEQQRRARALNEMNREFREAKITEEEAKGLGGRDEARVAELSSLRMGAQNADPADIASLERKYGLRAGAMDPYPEPDPGWAEPDTPLVLALVQQYQEKTLGLHAFVYALSGVAWDVCAWGCWQYATALAMFRALARLKRAGLDPTETMGWGKLADLGGNAIPVAEALGKIAAGMTAEICSRAEADGESPDDLELAEAASLRKCSTLDQAFAFMRKRSWDLRIAAAHTAQLVFKTDFSHVESNVGASSGKGPSLNILVQSDNYTTALRCFLLHVAGHVADPDTAYANFDT